MTAFAQQRRVTREILTAEQHARLAPELLALRDGLTEVGIGLSDAYPSDTHVLRVSVPLTRAVDGLFAIFARWDVESETEVYTTAGGSVAESAALTFYEWARRLRNRAGNLLFVVPKPGLSVETHIELAAEIASLQVAMNRLTWSLRQAGVQAEVVKAVRNVSDALADLNIWLSDCGWTRLQPSSEHNPYTDASTFPTQQAKSSCVVSAFADIFGPTGQGTEASQ